MFQECHALPVQASTMLHNFLDTVEQMMVVAKVITAIFYETPTEQLSEVLKKIICARGKK